MSVIRVTRNPFDAGRLGSYASSWIDTIVAFRPAGADDYHYVNPADYIRADSFNGTIDFLPEDDPKIQFTEWDRSGKPTNLFTRQQVGDVHIIQHIKQGCGGCRNKMKSQQWWNAAVYVNARQQADKLSQNQVNALVEVAQIKFDTWNANR